MLLRKFESVTNRSFDILIRLRHSNFLNDFLKDLSLEMNAAQKPKGFELVMSALETSNVDTSSAVSRMHSVQTDACMRSTENDALQLPRLPFMPQYSNRTEFKYLAHFRGTFVSLSHL